MAEQDKDKLHITLHVYDEEIGVDVKRDEEEYYRAAAKLITERYNAYAQVFKGRKSDHTIALMRVAGNTWGEIAKNLQIPPTTIKNHRREICKEIEEIKSIVNSGKG